jgi:hypothetical protein
VHVLVPFEVIDRPIRRARWICARSSMITSSRVTAPRASRRASALQLEGSCSPCIASRVDINAGARVSARCRPTPIPLRSASAAASSGAVAPETITPTDVTGPLSIAIRIPRSIAG